MLLERKDIHTALLDSQNQTPLELALSQGHHEVVKILQGRGQVDPSAADCTIYLPLRPPASCGN